MIELYNLYNVAQLNSVVQMVKQDNEGLTSLIQMTRISL